MIEETYKKSCYVIASNPREALRRLDDPEEEHVTVFPDVRSALEVTTDKYRFYHDYPVFEVTFEVKPWYTSST